jgi:TPP-dependent pyruvate/acetoin dehydrogenase alpha subunit
MSVEEFGLSETAPHENPLVPNAKLRQIYTAMVEARVLDEHIAKLQRKAKGRHRLYSTSGQEAIRVTTAVELQSGDLVSDGQMTVTMDYLLGAKPSALLRDFISRSSGTKARTGTGAKGSITGRPLPWIEGGDDTSDRLKSAIGAALALKTLMQSNLVLAYVDAAEMPKKSWKPILAIAAELNLPIIFVVLPSRSKENGKGASVCAKARSAGVPGIPVDANDAVALYRVAQESFGRTRGGDGPVLIECISGRIKGQRTEEPDDPILQMKDFLTGRKVCDQEWANHVGDALHKAIARTIPAGA